MPISVATAYQRYESARSALKAAGAELRRVLAIEAAELTARPPAKILRIIDTVAAHYDFEAFHILSHARASRHAEARHVAIWLCTELTNYSPTEIASFFKRHHGATMWAINSVNDRIATEPRFAATVAALRASF